MNKCHFVVDKKNKNKKLEDFFLTKYKNYPPQLSSAIVVASNLKKISKI